MTPDNALQNLYIVVLVILSVMTLLCLARAIRGPRIADRVVAVNMICTLTLAMICVLAMMLGEGYLLDVGLVYALIGFLAVVVLCKVYMGVALERRDQRAQAAAQNVGGEPNA
ncbi:MAG: monovalent cation/H+ antiporter complex subunit F [Eubacteriales bacterium]|nr:monovalent cation/H+ antiporter complex subunit F [Eubacteriales bacterium]